MYENKWDDVVPVAKFEAFRALKFSSMESFRAAGRLEDFRPLELSKFERFCGLKNLRALK